VGLIFTHLEQTGDLLLHFSVFFVSFVFFVILKNIQSTVDHKEHEEHKESQKAPEIWPAFLSIKKSSSQFIINQNHLTLTLIPTKI